MPIYYIVSGVLFGVPVVAVDVIGDICTQDGRAMLAADFRSTVRIQLESERPLFRLPRHQQITALPVGALRSAPR